MVAQNDRWAPKLAWRRDLVEGAYRKRGERLLSPSYIFLWLAPEKKKLHLAAVARNFWSFTALVIRCCNDKYGREDIPLRARFRQHARCGEEMQGGLNTTAKCSAFGGCECSGQSVRALTKTSEGWWLQHSTGDSSGPSLACCLCYSLHSPWDVPFAGFLSASQPLRHFLPFPPFPFVTVSCADCQLTGWPRAKKEYCAWRSSDVSFLAVLLALGFSDLLLPPCPQILPHARSLPFHPKRRQRCRWWQKGLGLLHWERPAKYPAAAYWLWRASAEFFPFPPAVLLRFRCTRSRILPQIAWLRQPVGVVVSIEQYNVSCNRG